MRRLKPTLWLSFGLISLTLALALTGYLFGLLPDGHKAELDARAKVAESLAIQLAGSASRNDASALGETIASVVERNEDVNSAALRGSKGNLIVSGGDHNQHWVESADGKSTPTHVTVPLSGPNGRLGAIEISFTSASSSTRLLGFPVKLLMFFAFLLAAGFIGYFIILQHTLKELDPGRVIPERVQKAFDTLSEGVIILDEKERILLMNSSFLQVFGEEAAPKIGTKINTLPWRMIDGSAQAGGYPWHAALREGREMREDFLSLRAPDSSIRNFNVNATVITNDRQKNIGAIVTLTDMTRLHDSNQALAKTVGELEKNEELLEHQISEIEYLSKHDSLTGVFNRRTLFQNLDGILEDGAKTSQDVAMLMLNVDHLKFINNNFGLTTGDSVLTTIARHLKSSIKAPSFVSRYAGDEFCVVLMGGDSAAATGLSYTIRRKIAEGSRNILPDDAPVTVSMGVSVAPKQEVWTAFDLINRADQAMHAAKRNGRNQTINWTKQLETAPLSRHPSGTGEAEHAVESKAVLTKHPPRKSDLKPGSSSIVKPTLNPAAHLQQDSHAAFESDVNLALEQAKAEDNPSAVVRLSIASWDYLVEALGNDYCDRLTLSLKRKIEVIVREEDKVEVAGSHGELMINLAVLDKASDAIWVVERIFECLNSPLVVDEKATYVSCKAGIALYPDHGRDGAALLRNSSMALRRAHNENKPDSFKLYSQDMENFARQRTEIELGIRESLQRDEFELYFQPIVDLQTGALSAAEALLRSNNDRLSGIPIDQIIGIAEQSSLISEVDLWVVNTALRQMGEWCDAGVDLPKISINLSATQLTNPKFMDHIYDSLKSAPFSSSRVQIEVTETAKLEDVGIAAPQLKRLQQLGAQIALDDFGTGQASLTYLQRLHPDVIKIDRSFVTGVNSNHANATLVGAMTVMAHCLGLKVVVEGVEDLEELEFLRETRCDAIQGYFISKPMPVSVMDEWIGNYESDEKRAAIYGSAETSKAA